MAHIEFSEVTLHMDVLCVIDYQPYILAGIGNNLFVYENCNLKLSKKIFDGERVHKICVKNDEIIVKGGRELAVVSIAKFSGKVTCQVLSKVTCADWIQDVAIINDNLIAVNTAHNCFEVWKSESREKLKVCSCGEQCILYSCKIVGDTQEDVVVLAGTVFGNVLIWGPFLEGNPVLHRLKAHNGAVFSIEVNRNRKILCTTSDDRSFKVWSLASEKAINSAESWQYCNIQLTHTLFGHTARVWRSLILPDFYVTIGEDSKLIIWNQNGDLIKSLVLHQDSGIRAVRYSSDSKTILTGGEDGGLNSISWKFLTSEVDASKIFTFERNFSTKVSFVGNGIIYTQSGGCVRVSALGEKVLFNSEHFGTYCLMEVTEDYILLGSIKGHLVVIDIKTDAVLIEGQFLQGRVFSIHWLGDRFLTCGSNGRLDLWEIAGENLNHLNQMTLPSCKERWTTCCVFHHDRLIIGDRMGNLHIFDPKKENPIKSFRKIHSFLGVTDIKISKNGILTIGRDGTIKTFSNDFVHLLTYKLPMDWPWKIIIHNNDELVLGFHSVYFVVWSMNDREIIASHDCGGGHRSCDFKLHTNQLTFLYVKEKKVLAIDLSLNEMFRIRKGFHSREINCLRMLPTNPRIIITGSEDTTLRISQIGKSEIETLRVFTTHTSSVRDVCVCFSNPNKLLIVSVGGKGQLVIWMFDVDTQICREVISHRLRKENRNWKSQLPDIDPETRIMCVDVLKIGDEFRIVTGCSDCQIRLFSYSQEFDLVSSVPYSHCILKIKALQLDSKVLVSTMGTDGRVVFWDVTNYTCMQQLVAIPIHQSGINSFQFQEITPEKFFLATGGDDNMISLSLVEVRENNVTLDILWQNSSTHSCQITGIKFLKNFLITTSIDQRITVWEWSYDSKFEMKYLNQYMTPVPDIHGIDADWKDDTTILICVYGKAVEILEVNVCSFIEPR